MKVMETGQNVFWPPSWSCRPVLRYLFDGLVANSLSPNSALLSALRKIAIFPSTPTLSVTLWARRLKVNASESSDQSVT
jgi:hypothetical protein